MPSVPEFDPSDVSDTQEYSNDSVPDSAQTEESVPYNSQLPDSFQTTDGMAPDSSQSTQGSMPDSQTAGDEIKDKSQGTPV